MTTFPIAGAIANPQVTESQQANNFEDWLASTKQLPGGTAMTPMTIAGGWINPAVPLIQLDTEGQASTDDLTNIDVAIMPAGSMILLAGTDVGRQITIKHQAGGTGSIIMQTGEDVVLPTLGSGFVWLIRVADSWYELPIGGEAGIIEHNEDPNAHEVMLNTKYPYLTADIDLYLSTIGSDDNDGLTVDTPLQTWPAMHALLASIDPRGHIVTVNISGIQPGDATFALPQYSSAKLKLLGTSTETDGFSQGQLFDCMAGSFEPHNLQFGGLRLFGNRHDWNSKTIRIAGVGSNGNFGIESHSHAEFYGCTFECNGITSSLFTSFNEKLSFHNCSFVGMTGQSSTEFFFVNKNGEISARTCTWTGFSNSGIDMWLEVGGVISVTDASLMPNGGTITRRTPSNINAYGCAVAGGYINANGVVVSGFGITNIVHVSNSGIFTITHNAGSKIVQATGQQQSGFTVGMTPTSATTSIIYTTNASGSKQDMSFCFCVF